jgi:hypothetical protein
MEHDTTPPPAARTGWRTERERQERIRACYRACEGIADPSAIPDLLAALRDALAAHDIVQGNPDEGPYRECCGIPYEDMYSGESPHAKDCWTIAARAALARAGGGKS